jgi:hypothetical protein
MTFGAALPLAMVAYGTLKSAVNYFARKLHFEHEGLSKLPVF